MGASATNRKYGRNLAKCKVYASEHRREKNKVIRVLHSGGQAAAQIYAAEYNVSSHLNRALERTS